MKARIEKVVSQLPATLEKNTVYYVRVANGFDIYVTNSTGVVAAYPANYAAKNHTHAEYVSIADTQTIYGQKNFWTYSGGNWYNNTMVVYSDGSANPAISFYKTGIDAAQLVYNGAIFSFVDSVSNNYVPVRANGFKKLGLTDDYCLLAGGGHILFKQFKKLQYVSNLNTVVDSGIYRQEQPSSGYFYTTTLNMSSVDGRQQLTIERSGGGMKFRGTPYGDGDQGFSDWRTVLTQELNESVTGLKMINRAQGNYASGWGLSKDRNTYSMVFDTNLGSSNNDNYGTALGFYSSVALNNEVHASIIVRNNSASGTSMGFATTDSFATGPQLAVSIANNGLVNFERQIPTFQNKILATQEWVSTSYIPKTHPAYGITQNYLNGWFTYKGYGDVRVLRPENIETQKLQFGFTAWNNDNNYPYADFLHFGGYSDSSGGNQNLIAFKKNGFGLRQWQGTSQSPATYQSFVDYWNSENFNPDNKVNKSGDTMTGKLNVLGGLSVVGNNVGSHNTKVFLKNNSASKAWAISAGIEGVFEDNLAFGNWDENNQSFGAHLWLQNDGLIVTNNYGTSLNWYQAYNWGNHANAGYATQNWVTTNFAAKNHNHPEYQPAGNYVTQSGLDSQLLNYASQSWVNNNFATQSWVSNNFLSASSFTKEVKIENSEVRLTPFDLIVYSNFNMFDTDNRLVYVTLSDGGDIVMKNIFRFQNIHIMNTSDKFGVFKVENTNIAIEIESHTTMNAYVNGDGRLVNISGGTAYLI